MKCTPRPTADIKMEAMPGVKWGGWVDGFQGGVGVLKWAKKGGGEGNMRGVEG